MKNLYTTPDEITVDEYPEVKPVTEQIKEIINEHIETPKKDNTMINMIIIALVIVVVIGLLVYYFKKRNEND